MKTSSDIIIDGIVEEISKLKEKNPNYVTADPIDEALIKGYNIAIDDVIRLLRAPISEEDAGFSEWIEDVAKTATREAYERNKEIKYESRA